MPTTRTICTECRSVVTLPEPAEVGDVVPCPKCEQYFTVPKTKIVPTPGAAKPAQAVAAKPKAVLADELPKKKPVVVVEEEDDEDEEEEEERPKKKKKRPSGDGPRRKKKKKRRDEEEGNPAKKIIRLVVLGVLLTILGVLGYMLYKKMKEPPPPDIIIPAKDEDYSKPITKAELDKAAKKAKAKQP